MGPRSAMLFVLFLCAMTTHLSTGIIIFKDVFTGDEMFSDIYKVKTTEYDFFYEVEGKTVTRKRVAAFVASAQLAVKQILLSFAYYQFFRGETDVDREGMVALLDYREDGVTPYMVFFKDGLKEEMATQ
ncbi:tRNA 2'-phosphotransferase [Branchiostoma belcheri]|nr:tRNA 2'-phosphotransferase [Branchiostoma belcheri]